MSDPAEFRDTVPEINDLVRVSVPASGTGAGGSGADSVPSRVENVMVDETGRRYMIASPWYRGDSELPAMGTPCTLEWPGTQGLWLLPVAFICEELAREDLRVWVLDTMGPAWQQERRSFMRVDWSLPVTLTLMNLADARRAVAGGLQAPTMVAAPATEGLPDKMSGETTNISEGGVRLLLPEPALPVGLGVMVHLEVSGQTFTLPSRVRWARPSGRSDALQADTALAFDTPEVHGDRLRPLLFAEQLRIRRARLA